MKNDATKNEPYQSRLLMDRNGYISHNQNKSDITQKDLLEPNTSLSSNHKCVNFSIFIGDNSILFRINWIFALKFYRNE